MAVKAWLAERLPLEFLRRFTHEQLSELQPRHVNWLHTLGFTALLLFLMQLGTGLLLLFYYKPGAQTAYHSVQFITEKVTLGGFIRQMHVWGASFIVTVVLLHLLRVYFSGAYKKPRELTWMAGMGLLLVTLLFTLTGYLLPWDQVAYWGTVVATDTTKEVPLLGPFLLQLVRGGETVSELTLTRFFALHVVVLPMALFALLALHLFLVRYHGIAPLTRTDEPPSTEEQLRAAGARPYYPDHFKREVLIAYSALAVLVAVALCRKPHLGEAANPLVTPTGIKPEWYFLPVYQSLKYVPGWLGVLGNGLLVLFLLLLPLLDRNPERHPRRRKLALWAGILFLAGGLVLGLLGHLSDTTRELFGRRVHFDNKGLPRVLPEGEAAPP
ncbi:MAG: cytochrome bc complex cytochrome b subunit [candidate division KSB1 bacterium]|nr:cytochrome bc complex cytochrome b subunit [candidate division KSB1 bacterium]MDZ7276568.1 cytochrome bc complex cytochrome b subunit [candidate division KSB1 bacterium]MDZ7285013.1 cytochrome bc complex cytochrome b subunit [candidate division KSB1 bacterium]MDZ7298045.1 cytochrome bc complex cytochrome b subunit [candidate division KSB1 bacterium]MDZ7307433.1 cytochrome bc complex cytochrome b subunit [candidate division KSB1 bacterium]